LNVNTGFFTGHLNSEGAYIFRTTDAGTSWFGSNIIASNLLYTIYFSDINTGYLAGGLGTVIKTTDGGGIYTNITGNQNIIPDNFSLFQNYPNPFNPTTKIKFALPPSTKGERLGVRVVIYDALGREVQTLVNESLQPGTYEVEFDGSNFSSGVYYYTLQTDNFIETKRMVMVK